MRRTTVILAVFVVLLGASWGQAALTDTQVVGGEYVTLSTVDSTCYWHDGGTGGEFQMTVYTKNSDGTYTQQGDPFYTFCADANSDIWLDDGRKYYVGQVLSDKNHLGYTLSDYGKWIYYEYAKDASPYVVPGHTSLTSLTASVTDPDGGGQITEGQLEAGAVAEGIWQEMTNGSGDTEYPDGWGHGAYDTVTGASVAVPHSGSWYSVYNTPDHGDSTFTANEDEIGIAQLQLDGGDEQDQLVLTMVGAGMGHQVPEPAAIVIWSVLGAVSWLGTRAWRKGWRR